jgi:glycine dehydrogenase subunit 1
LAGVSLGRLYPEVTPLAHGLLVAVTETSTEEELEQFATALEGALS